MAADLQIAQAYMDPTIVFGADYMVIQPFFQYLFPPKHLSPQASGLLETLTDTQKDDLYNRMLTAVGITCSDILFSYTLGLKNSTDMKMVVSMGLSDSSFLCDRRKGFSFITNATTTRTSEHKLTALSRRLRNSFAHGRIGVFGDYVLLEDQSENKHNGSISITGRIVLNKADLRIWKDTIKQYADEIGFVMM